MIERLEAAGAILVGALNMGEYAYDFTGENIHDGASRNPHDLERMTGGSSGGSGAAVGGGLVPLALGSDTNGSIRVPSSLCGIFGLKPTYGRLTPRADLSLRRQPRSSRAVRAHGARSRARLRRHAGIRCRRSGLRRSPGRAGRAATGTGRGAVCASPSPAAISNARAAKPATPSTASRRRSAPIATSRFRKPERARSAAFIITASEGASLHLNRLRSRARDFDPAVRDRLIAGAMTPASLVVKAQKFRRWYRDQVVKLFDEVDAILAPATPCTAPLIGQQTFMFGDTELPVRANLGLYTQPISFIGLPVVAVPVPLDPLPIGVQIITAPWREDVALRLAHALEVKGVVGRRGRRCRGRVCIAAFQPSSLTPTIMRTMASTARTIASRARVER